MHQIILLLQSTIFENLYICNNIHYQGLFTHNENNSDFLNLIIPYYSI